MDARPPAFGPFRVRTAIGAGQFGPVYRGYDLSTDRSVSIRTFELPELTTSALARTELLASLRRLCINKLEHPDIARPLDCGVKGDVPFLVLEYVPGSTVDELVRQDGARPPTEVLERVTHIAAAIDFAAAADVLHGMLTPDNVICDLDITRVTGFGVVEALLRVGVPVAAAAPYASPQRVAGARPTRADDVYSLAAVTLELLIGGSADGGQDASRALRQAQGLPDRRRLPRPAPHETRLFTRIAGVDAGRLRASFAPALAEEANKRPSTASDFVNDLQDALSSKRTIDPVFQVKPNPLNVFPHEEEDAPDLPLRSGRLELAKQAESVDENLRVERHADSQPSLDLPFRDPDSERTGHSSTTPVVVRDVGREEPPLPSTIPMSGVAHASATSEKSRLLAVAASLVVGLVVGFWGGYVLGQQGSGIGNRDSPFDYRSGRPEQRRGTGLGIRPSAKAQGVPGKVEGRGSEVGTTDSGSRTRESGVGTRESGAATASASTTSRSTTDASPGSSTPAPALSAASSPAVTTQPAAPVETAPPAPDPQLGRVLVRSTPSGARVLVDGEMRGVTPLASRDLSLTEHTIEVVYPGFDARQRRVILTARRPAQSIDFDLQPATTPTSGASATADALGALQITSRPVGAQVFVDDNLVGTTPLLVPNVSTGPHHLRIESPGHQSWSTTVQIERGKRFRVVANLEQ